MTDFGMMAVHMHEWARLIRLAKDPQALLTIAEDIDINADALAPDVPRAKPGEMPDSSTWSDIGPQGDAPVRPVAPREQELRQLIAKWHSCADALSPGNQLAIGTVHEQCYRNESLAYRRCAAELEPLAAAPVPCAAAPADRLLREISDRLAKRLALQFGTCQLCGHRQEMMPTYQTIASSMAAEQWKCQSCGGQIVFTITIGGNEPTQDEDIATLLELARLRGGIAQCANGQGSAGDRR